MQSYIINRGFETISEICLLECKEIHVADFDTIGATVTMSKRRILDLLDTWLLELDRQAIAGRF